MCGSTGKPVGYSQGAHLPSEFNISAYIRPGQNLLAVRVLQYSDGSYLEDQDMWRLSGIFRDVYLTARPTVYLQDMWISGRYWMMRCRDGCSQCAGGFKKSERRKDGGEGILSRARLLDGGETSADRRKRSDRVFV
jgi:beta-galactosidase/beta-glucuronidase